LHGHTLRAIDGFPPGGNYGECIAAGTAVSRVVEALGLKVVQLSAKTFYCFSHAEWENMQKRPRKPRVRLGGKALLAG
jgi:hypothetical protein